MILSEVTFFIIIVGYINFFRLNIKTKSGNKLNIKDILLVINGILLTLSASIVLLGTLYPLVLEVFEISSITVGPGYFNTVMIPIFMPLLFLLGISPNFNKVLNNKSLLIRQIIYKFIVSLLIACFINLVIYEIYEIFYISIALACFIFIWIIVNLFFDIVINLYNKSYSFLKRYISFYIAHFGVALMLLGISMSSMYTDSLDVKLKLGDKVNLGNYEFSLIDLKKISKSNYKSKIAVINVLNKKDNTKFSMLPEKRFYPNSQMLLTEVALKANLDKDIYLALGDVITEPNNSYITLRIKIMPFIRFLWLGGVLIFLSALLGFIRL